MPGWLRNSLVLAAVIAVALLLWVGFALLVTVLLVIAIPFAIWSAFARRRVSRGPVTLEGAATRVEEPAAPRIGEDKAESADGARAPAPVSRPEH